MGGWGQDLRILAAVLEFAMWGPVVRAEKMIEELLG
jgi:hypothetical protein